MKKLHYIVSTDWHLKSSNLNLILSLISDQCQLAKEHGLNDIVCLGDVFDSRVSQRVDVLYGFLQILEHCESHDITLICIPGNHDKTSYTDIISFLHPFKNHPSLHLVDTYQHMIKDEINYHFVPYFDEEKSYKEYLDRVDYKGNDVLFSHIALTGSVNNDGSSIENSLKKETFKKFKKVYLGHYHDTQEITKDIIHIPSIQQNNFGENDNKGYTYIYDDFTYEIVNSSFKPYVKVKYDLSKVSITEIDNELGQYDPEDAYYKLVFEGKDSSLKTLNLPKYKDLGYQVQVKNKILNANEQANLESVNIYNQSNIVELFKEFCECYDYTYKTGFKYLNSVMNEAK